MFESPVEMLQVSEEGLNSRAWNLYFYSFQRTELFRQALGRNHPLDSETFTQSDIGQSRSGLEADGEDHRRRISLAKSRFGPQDASTGDDGRSRQTRRRRCQSSQGQLYETGLLAHQSHGLFQIFGFR